MVDWTFGPSSWSVPSGWSLVGPNNGGFFPSYYVYTAPSAAPAPAPAGSPVATSTGVNPVEASYSLYGHTVPLSVLGRARIGGEIVSGPYIANGLASFGISFGFPADPTGTRTLREIAFDSQVVWDITNGFHTEAFTYRFYQGTYTQAADALETAHFGSNAIAYRPQMILFFENLPLANTKFGKIPYVAAVIQDGTGADVNLGEAFRRLAYSPWVGYTSSQFDTIGITDGLVNGGLIIAQDAEFLATIQHFGRFYPSWDILQTDKLRIVDRGATTSADINLDKTRLMGQIFISRQEPNSVPRKLELSTIDPDADYTIVPATAQRPLAPVAVTTSVATEAVYLPAVMDSPTRTAIVTFAKYHEEWARKKISGTAMMYGLQIEPGDLVAIINLGADFNNEVFRVIETLHGANYSVEFTAESILRCTIGLNDPHLSNVKLLLGFEGTNGSTTIVDESPAAHGFATPHNTAQISTAQFKFGASSYVGDGVGATRITYPDSLDWQLSAANSDQFTVEAFIRPNVTNNVDRGLLWQGFSVGSLAWAFGTTPGGSNGELVFSGSTTGAAFDWTAISSGITWVAGQWYHVAADKDSSGKLRVYRDGIMVASSTPADSSMNNSTEILAIGGDTAGGTRSWNGYMDEVRITKGYARYASDGGYTVPTEAFPRI
jgi:hypothetical protein